MNRRRQLILIITSLIRIFGTAAFLFLNPLTAYIINAALDMSDGPIHKNLLKLEPTKAQLIDKTLDPWLYTAAASYTLLNPQPFTPTLIGLYLYRLTGQLLFAINQNRRVLVYFPNVFELGFLYFYFPPTQLLTPTIHTFALTALFLIKIIHEITLHRYQLTIFDNLLRPTLRKMKQAFAG